MADKNNKSAETRGEQENVTYSFLKTIGLINTYKDAQKQKALENIESSARLALSNARKIGFLFSVLINQVSNTRVEKPKATTNVSTVKKIVENAKSSFKVSSILKGLLLLIPLLSLMLSDEVKENLKTYLEEFLRAFGVTEKALNLIKWAISSLDDLLKIYLGYKVISKLIKLYKLLRLLGKATAIALRFIFKNCGMGLPMPEVPPEPGRPIPGGIPGTTPVEPIPNVRLPVVAPYVSPYALLPGRTNQPISLPGQAGGLRLPAPAVQVVPPPIPRLGGPTALTTAPSAAGTRPTRTPGQIEDAKIIREIKTAPPGSPIGTKFLDIIKNISRIIPIINLLIGLYDVYVGAMLIKEGKTTDGALTVMIGLGTIALGIGEILALPILAGVGLTAVLVGGVGLLGKKLYEYFTERKTDFQVTNPMGDFIVSPEEPTRVNSLSSEIIMAKNNTRMRDTDVVIITKPVVVFNRAFA